MTKRKTTQMMLAEMLTENTGRNMLDSGGAYGRNWERQQGRTLKDFQNEPYATLSEWGYTKSVFHFLSEAVDYDARLDSRFQRFINKPEEQYNHWMQSVENYLDYLKKTGYVTGIYGDGDEVWVNTYNSDDALSQVIQYCYFTYSGTSLPEDTYVILQIHGGCDVRGGYTRPRLFRAGEDILFNADGMITCKGVPTGVIEGQQTLDGSNPDTWGPYHRWTTDDTYNWYPDGMGIDSIHLDDLEKDEEGHLLCPECNAVLEAW